MDIGCLSAVADCKELCKSCARSHYEYRKSALECEITKIENGVRNLPKLKAQLKEIKSALRALEGTELPEVEITE
jgi:hypothetical protein